MEVSEYVLKREQFSFLIWFECDFILGLVSAEDGYRVFKYLTKIWVSNQNSVLVFSGIFTKASFC